MKFVQHRKRNIHTIFGWITVKRAYYHCTNCRLNRISRYVGRFDNSENFGWHVWFEACRCGFRDAKEVIYIGDGAVEAACKNVVGKRLKQSGMIKKYLQTTEGPLSRLGKVLHFFFYTHRRP